jgi:cytochrome P450
MAITPPWPKPLPYTANLLRRLARGWSSWFGLLNEWDFRISLGDLNLFGLRVFLVNDPALLRRVLVEEVEFFPKHPYTLWILEPLIGRAIFSVNGEEWALQRRLIDQAFQAAQLERVYPAMAAATEAMLERLERDVSVQADASEGSLVDIEAVMTWVTADVIVRTILSRPLQETEAREVVAAFSRYQRRAARALVLRFLRLPRRWVQSSLQRDAAVIRGWIESVIEQRLAAANPGGDDLLACLMAAKDPQTGRRFTAQELVDQVCFLFLAGHETSASGLSSACWLLALDQAVQQRLQQEVDALPQPLTPVALRQMPYGAAVFQETLRLYPPVSFFIRERQGEATTLMASDAAPSRCPVGSLLTLSPWVIHRHEQHWPQPHQFRPERFLLGEASADERQCSREVWLPYGMGPRKCPGAAFAHQEALLVLAELLRCYQLLPAPGLPSPEWVGRLTLRSTSGIFLRLLSRKETARTLDQGRHIRN